ncbi:MAG: hypothetical protein H7287_01815 [Thermoleophilia bacterium]|nr:hypothetical protein [Thermoleophilia bacterium]
MSDVATAFLIAGSVAFLVGLAAQVRAHRHRIRWSQAGLGLEEQATGLASLVAAPVLFPAELETARATNTQLAVLVFRRFSEHPETFGRRLAETLRVHETGWRIDYDLFATTIVVKDRDAAVLAAARIGAAACGSESRRDLRVGIAMCPEDADDLLDALDVGMRRMRGFGLLDAVATRLRLTRPALGTDDIAQPVADAG